MKFNQANFLVRFLEKSTVQKVKLERDLAAIVGEGFHEQGLSDCDIEALKKLKSEDLEKMGATKMGDKQRLLCHIEKLVEM